MAVVRPIHQLVDGRPATDGAGVKLTRIIGTPDCRHLDPFLMLDAFRSDREDDYIAGFPDHPHRGFETVTYLLEGRMRHADSVGNQGLLEAGSVQWMTAGSGIIHSEMPERDQGRLWGYQLWVNLPARQKMIPPRYQDIPAARITRLEGEGWQLRVIAGTFDGHQGPAQSITGIRFFDLALEPGASFVMPVDGEERIVLTGVQGEVINQTDEGFPTLGADRVAIMGPGDTLALRGGAAGGRVLILGGKPLHEPIVQYGPFVMNRPEEIETAIRDYQTGRLAMAAEAFTAH